MPEPELSREELWAEIGKLRQHLAVLSEERDDLVLLLETNLDHSDRVTEELLSKFASTKATLAGNIVTLRREIFDLQHDILRLQKEKADLELLLEMSTKHSDIVEEDLLKKVEATLRDSERQFRLLSETIPIPITVSRTRDHAIIYANDPASKLFGVPLESLYSHKLVDFYPPEIHHQWLEFLAAEGYVNNYELQGYKLDGTSFYGALYVRPLAFNHTPCFLCAIYDMTERKRVEDEIRILNEELEARVQKRTQQLEVAHAKIVKLEKDALEVQMAGGFAHEMRNALVGAKLMLASLMSENESLCQKNAQGLGELYDIITPYLPEAINEKVVDYCEQIDHNEEVLDQTLSQVNQALVNALGVTTLILEYSRLGRASAGQDRVKLREVIERIVQEHQTAFAEQGIMLQAILPIDGELSGHESHFHSILNNIILNARDELVQLNDDRQRCIDVRLYQNEAEVIVTIADNANGIPEKDLPRIFEPFFSTKPATGTGLGLSFVSKLVPLYHGTIEVNSTVHQGTTFTLRFPVKS